MVGAFATGGRRCTVGGRCIVVARRVVRHWAPFGDVALLWHVAWWGDMPPSAGVPMWGHVATCPHGMIRNVAAGGVALSGDVELLWHVTWLGAHATVGGCPDVGARCHVPPRDDLQCCRRGRCIVVGCGIVVARHVVGGTRHRRWTFQCRGTLPRAPLQRAPTRSNTQIIS
jgi:hypothetical protein